jgi:hypothetical protein
MDEASNDGLQTYFIPALPTYRESAFAGFFGPIGMSLLLMSQCQGTGAHYYRRWRCILHVCSVGGYPGRWES